MFLIGTLTTHTQNENPLGCAHFGMTGGAQHPVSGVTGSRVDGSKGKRLQQPLSILDFNVKTFLAPRMRLMNAVCIPGKDDREPSPYQNFGSLIRCGHVGLADFKLVPNA